MKGRHQQSKQSLDQGKAKFSLLYLLPFRKEDIIQLQIIILKIRLASQVSMYY